MCLSSSQAELGQLASGLAHLSPTHVLTRWYSFCHHGTSKILPDDSD